MPQDDLDHIPSIVPSRDSDVPAAGKARAARKPAGGRGGRNGGGAGKPPSAARTGAGPLARLMIAVALAAAAAACAWAWQLQQKLQQSNEVMEGYQLRIKDLEDRLSDTDEGMNQNAEVQAAKIRELDTEVRKLWDNVWKKSKERLSALEAENASQTKKLGSAETKLESAAGDIARLKSVAGDLERLMASAKANQAEVERVADSLNRINLELAKLNKRVEGNEEWVGSINAFRRQVNATLTDLQASIRALQAP